MNHQRMLDEFEYLVSLDSITFHEEKIARYLKTTLMDLGFQVVEDNASSYYNSTANNIYGYLKGSLPGSPILFSSHMDTVEPGLHKQAVVHQDGKITSNGTTVLGADDISGIVSILEAVRSLQEEKCLHRDIEVLFTIAEEAYLRGSDLVQYSRIKAKTAYVLDLSGPIGTAAIKAPTLIAFEAVFQGKEAHAGFAPNEGIHAISMAAKAISLIKNGYVDKESTVNIGKIEGGVATNIVPERCSFKGEIRSYRHERALQLFEEIQQICENTANQFHGKLQISSTIPIYAYEVPSYHPVILHLKKAATNIGIHVNLISTFGGSDNNNFVRNGITGIVLACGMQQVHSLHEYTTIKDLILCARLVKELMTSEE